MSVESTYMIQGRYSFLEDILNHLSPSDSQTLLDSLDTNHQPSWRDLVRPTQQWAQHSQKNVYAIIIHARSVR